MMLVLFSSFIRVSQLEYKREPKLQPPNVDPVLQDHVTLNMTLFFWFQ